jgi:hypothetical protein
MEATEGMNVPRKREFVRNIGTGAPVLFTWWINRKDAAGRNIFQGGFLGLDNIGVFDRTFQVLSMLLECLGGSNMRY